MLIFVQSCIIYGYIADGTRNQHWVKILTRTTSTEILAITGTYKCY